MSQDVINEQTDENIKSYLTENEKEDKTEDDKWSDVPGDDDKGKSGFRKNKKLIFVILFLILAVVLTAAYFMHSKDQQSFDKEKVKIEVKVLSEITSGEEIAFTIEYKNETGVELKDPKVTLFIPEKFVFISSEPQKVNEEETVLNWNVGDLPAGRTGRIKLFGKITGEKDSEYEFNSKISYTPDNFNYEFQSADSLSRVKVKITSVSFELSLKCPEEIIIGDEIDCLVAYKNVSDDDFRKIDIEVDFPEGFTFISSEPEIDGGTENGLSWKIEGIEPKAKGELTIKGSLTADKDEEKEMKVTMDIFENKEDLLEHISKEAIIKVWKIPISLEQTANGLENTSISKGEEIEYKIKFKNISNRELKGLVINSELESGVDFDSIEAVNGSYDRELNKIIWSAFSVPGLAVFKPGDEGEVVFKVKAKDYFETESSENKNFAIKNKVTVSSFNFNAENVEIERRIVSDEMSVKINSFLSVEAKGYFNDDGRIINTGAIPPEVGKETKYTIHWNLNSLLGDTKNVKITSVLPDNVKWTGNYINSNGTAPWGGDESNGAFTPVTVDPLEVSDINGGLGKDGLEVSYCWNDATVYKDSEDKGLPEDLQFGDMLEVIFSDGDIKQIGYCVTTKRYIEGRSGYCSVPWQEKIVNYGSRENYKIQKAPFRKEFVSDENTSGYYKTLEEKLYYNTETREVVWVIPSLDANTESKEIVYQVSITPEEANIGEVMEIMNELKAVGFDEFTNTEVAITESGITTELPDDYSIGTEEGIVINGVQEEDKTMVFKSETAGGIAELVCVCEDRNIVVGDLEGLTYDPAVAFATIVQNCGVSGDGAWSITFTATNGAALTGDVAVCSESGCIYS